MSVSIKNTDNIRIFAGNSHPDLAKKVCDILGINLGKLRLPYFSNTEARPLLDESVRDKDIYIFQTGWADASNGSMGIKDSDQTRSINDHILETGLLMDTCRRSGSRSITLFMPCYPYARQDKKDSPRASISSAYVAKLFEFSGLTRIVCVELHAACIQGFFTICADNLYTTNLIVENLPPILGPKYKTNCVVVSPDAGGFARARIVSDKLKVPFLAMSKKRDYSCENKVEKSILLGDRSQIEGKTAIIVDDMLDTGGTMVKTVNLLTEYGAKDIVVAVTHGILSGPAIDRINSTEALKAVLISDTLPCDHLKARCDKIHIFTIAKLLADVLLRLVKGESISELFD